MNRAELKEWSKSKIKGNVWKIVGIILVTTILTSLTLGGSYNIDQDTGNLSYNAGINVGFIFAFVEVGFYAIMINFINDKDFQFKDLFNYSSEFVRCLVTKLLSTIFVFLWTLLLIIPGIMKSLGYSLIPFLLGDDKYKDLSYTDLLKKSEEMMNGHKMDLFVLGLSFIGWHILAVFTLGLLELWILPYQYTAMTKFLNDIKLSYEGTATPVEAVVEEVQA